MALTQRESSETSAKLARLELVRPKLTTAATLAHERMLPVAAGLHELIPGGGLQRGSTLVAHGVGSTSFVLAAVSEAVRQGSFLAVVAPRSFGLAACLDFDIPLRRVVQFMVPGQAQGAGWAQVMAAVIDGFDLVVLAGRYRATPSQARQLVVRSRERGSVLLRVGGQSWPDSADLRFDLGAPEWHGLGDGHGHLQSRVVSVHVAGRRWHGGNQVHHVRLPGGANGVEPVAEQNASRAGADRATVSDRSAVPDRSA